jgi:hypothetical protein
MRIKEILFENDSTELETMLALKFNITLSKYDKTNRALELIDNAKTNEYLIKIRAALVNANSQIQKLLNSKEFRKFQHYQDFGKFQTDAMQIKKNHSLLINKIDSMIK